MYSTLFLNIFYLFNKTLNSKSIWRPVILQDPFQFLAHFSLTVTFRAFSEKYFIRSLTYTSLLVFCYVLNELMALTLL